MLGAAKIVLAVLFGGSLLLWLQSYPKSVLGVLLLFSGLELALVCRDQNKRVDYFVMLITTGACMAISTVVVGLLVAGMLFYGVFRLEPSAKAKD